MADPGTLPRPSPTNRALPRGWGIDIGVLVLATVALRLPAFRAAAHLSFDDGVYGASAVAMRDGALPFRDVFSSQGPAFLPLVRLADLIGFQSLDAPRLLPLLSAVALAAAVYAAGRAISDRTGALLAAGLATTSGSILWVTGPIHSDGPALAAATAAFWLAVRWRRRPSTGLAVGVGVLVGVALSIKATTLPVLLPVAWLLLGPLLTSLDGSAGGTAPGRGRAVGMVAVAGGAAAAVWLVPTLLFGPADVWDQSITYHREVAGDRDVWANARKIFSTLLDRDLPVLVFGGVSLLTTLLSRTGRHRRADAGARSVTSARDSSVEHRWRTPSDATLLGAWLVASFGLLLWIEPLWRPHVSGLIPPAVLLIGLHRPSIRVTAVLALLLAPLQIWRLSDFLWPSGYRDRAAEMIEELDELPEDAWVISDEPGLVWRAGRRPPDDLVDTSILRLESGRITPSSLAEAAADDRVCAVAVWSPDRLGSLPELPALLAEVGYEPTATFDDDRVLYTRPDCPTGDDE